MATIEELERRAHEIDEAENAAIFALSEAARELAVQLPDGSQFAVQLARLAGSLERISRYSDGGASSAALDLVLFTRETYKQRVEGC
jgi:hypothetical protein